MKRPISDDKVPHARIAKKPRLEPPNELSTSYTLPTGAVNPQDKGEDSSDQLNLSSTAFSSKTPRSTKSTTNDQPAALDPGLVDLLGENAAKDLLSALSEPMSALNILDRNKWPSVYNMTFNTSCQFIFVDSKLSKEKQKEWREFGNKFWEDEQWADFIYKFQERPTLENLRAIYEWSPPVRLSSPVVNLNREEQRALVKGA